MLKITPSAAALLLAASGSILANDHVAEVEQYGIGNIAEQTQSGVMQRSLIIQVGIENSVLTAQSGTSSESGQAGVAQVGTMNSAEIYQVNGSRPGMASADIYQAGTSNSATLEQHQYLDELAATATLHQEGDGNQVDARQTWVGNDLGVVSIGQGNVVQVDQSGFSTADIQQNGTANRVRLEQVSSGFGGGFAVVEQNGTANQADIRQSSGRYPAADVSLRQVGTANVAQIETGDGHSTLDYRQQGTGNELDAYLAGHNSSLTGFSEGDYNLVVTSQGGDDNNLDIAQVGSENQIEAIQGMSPNDAWVSQAGDGNRAYLRQDRFTGDSASATIVQNGNGNVASVIQQ